MAMPTPYHWITPKTAQFIPRDLEELQRSRVPGVGLQGSNPNARLILRNPAFASLSRATR
jgi:hypothetical protein